MPGTLLHLGATVQCPHGGLATPTSPFPRVLVSGQPITTQPYTWVVACPLSNSPCATATWIAGATRVLGGGAPVLLTDSQSVTANGSKLLPTVTQLRTSGQ